MLTTSSPLVWDEVAAVGGFLLCVSADTHSAFLDLIFFSPALGRVQDSIHVHHFSFFSSLSFFPSFLSFPCVKFPTVFLISLSSTFFFSI